MSRGGGRYTVGVDFGTLSGRAVVVRVEDGLELGCAVHEYAQKELAIETFNHSMRVFHYGMLNHT